jgi:hypothetical protein
MFYSPEYVSFMHLCMFFASVDMKITPLLRKLL